MASLHKLRIASDDLSLFDLPNEIFIHVLDLLPTQLLLQTRSVCHRFQNLIIRIIHGRLLRAASLTDRKLILECYHPSAQYTEPYLYCDYLGTPGLSDEIEGQGLTYEIANDQATKVATLGKLYSHFRPTRKDPEPKIYRSHPAGDVPGSRTSEAANRIREPLDRNTVTKNVSLEAHELFMQLRFLVAVVQTGPRRGFFHSVQNLIDKTQRVFRKWLAERAETTKEHNTGASDGVTNKLGCKVAEMLWIDQNKIAGLRVRVEERKVRRDLPILLHKDEDQAVSYSLELEELVVSTTHLLLAIERQLLATGGEGNGQAMIFGNFAMTTTQQTEETLGNAVS